MSQNGDGNPVLVVLAFIGFIALLPILVPLVLAIGALIMPIVGPILTFVIIANLFKGK